MVAEMNAFFSLALAMTILATSLESGIWPLCMQTGHDAVVDEVACMNKKSE